MMNYEDLKNRWKEYFEKLLNEDYPGEAVDL